MLASPRALAGLIVSSEALCQNGIDCHSYTLRLPAVAATTAVSKPCICALFACDSLASDFVKVCQLAPVRFCHTYPVPHLALLLNFKELVPQIVRDCVLHSPKPLLHSPKLLLAIPKVLIYFPGMFASLFLLSISKRLLHFPKWCASFPHAFA